MQDPFVGGGAMGAAMAATDWSATPLGVEATARLTAVSGLREDAGVFPSSPSTSTST